MTRFKPTKQFSALWPNHPEAEHRRSIQDEGLMYWVSQNKAMAVCLAAVIVIILVKWG